jgi:hypothetical protein
MTMSKTNEWDAWAEREAARDEWDRWAESEVRELEHAIELVSEGNMTEEEFDRRF